MAVFLQSLLFIFMVLLSLFLILIILLQRGKGGGLVGAFGGAGGSSAFGAKTSDVFLKITVWAAVIWFVACFGGRYILAMKSNNSMVDKATGNAISLAAPETTDGASESGVSTEAPASAESTSASDSGAESAATTDAPASSETPASSEASESEEAPADSK